MLSQLLRFDDSHFTAGEKNRYLADQASYIDLALKTVRQPTGGNRLLGNSFLVLEKHRGSGSAIGFLTTLVFLDSYAKSQGFTSWLESQLESVAEAGGHEICEYAYSVIEDPIPEIQRLIALIGKNSSLFSFIASREAAIEGFSTGAFLLVGILLHADDLQNTFITTA